MTEFNEQVEVVEGQTELPIEDDVVTAQTEGKIEMTNSKKKFPTKKVVAVGVAGAAAVGTGVAIKQAMKSDSGLGLKVSRAVGTALHATGKHAPLMLTAAGIVGLGATAFLAYRAKDRVNDIIEDMEYRRENDEEVSRMEVVRGLTGALALPVVTGLVSVGAIGASYVIMNRRVSSLASALAVSTAENEYFRRKYIARHSEEEYNEFMNTESQEVTTRNEETGKDGTETKEVRVDRERLRGRWFSGSQYYTSDDHGYNLAFLQAAKDKLDLKLFRKGHLTLNEVLDELGFEREKSGFALGWSVVDSFDLRWSTSEFKSDHELIPQLYISWTKPRYVYDEVETEGRYGIFGE